MLKKVPLYCFAARAQTCMHAAALQIITPAYSTSALLRFTSDVIIHVYCCVCLGCLSGCEQLTHTVLYQQRPLERAGQIEHPRT